VHDTKVGCAETPRALKRIGHTTTRRGSPASPAESGQAGDFAVVASPLTGTESVPAEPLAGKVVIDTCNYFPNRDGHFPEIDTGKLTVAGYLQAHLPTSRVVRAFNHIDAAQIVSDGAPEGTPNRRALALAGDDDEAKRIVAHLYNQFGFDAVDIGGLEESWRLDVDQPTFVVRQNAEEMRANVARAERHLSN
jgi:8-hydroxy-5-deazaflavin:NADPH oxidoreductase